MSTVEGRRILLSVGPTLKEHTELCNGFLLGIQPPAPLVLLQLL